MTQNDVADGGKNNDELLDELSRRMRQTQWDIGGRKKIRLDLKDFIDLVPREDQRLRLRATRLLAESLTQSGLHDDAYDLLKDALELDDVGQSEHDSLRTALGGAAIKSGRQEECLVLFDSPNIPEASQAGNALAASEVLKSLDRHVEAVQRLKDFGGQQWPPSLSCAVALQQLGIFLDESGQPLQALSVFKRALRVLEMSGESDESFLSWSSGLHNSISVSLHNLGRIDEAAREADKAILAAQSIRKGDALAVALLSRGNACEAGGQTELALTYFHRGLVASAQSENRAREITLLNNIALCYLRLGQSTLYVRYVFWALDVTEEFEDWPSRALALCNLAALSESTDARVMLTEAYALYLRLGSQPGQAAVLHQMAELARREGYSEDALEHAGDALKIAREVMDPQLLIMCHGQVGELLTGHDPDAAWNGLMECFSWSEALRRETGVAEVRLHMMESLDTHIGTAINLAVEQADTPDQQKRDQWLERLFTVLERARARVMLDQIESRNDDAQEILPPELRREMAELRNRIRVLRDTLGTIKEDTAADSRATVVDDLARSRKKLADIHAFLAQSNLQFSALSSAAPVSPEWLLATVPGDTAILTFAEVAGNLISLTYARGKFTYIKHRKLKELQQLDRGLRDASASLGDRAMARDLSSKLGEAIIEPVLNLCSLEHAKHLLIIPLPELFSAPLDGYLVNGRYLFERFTISYLPSVSVAQHLGDFPRLTRGLVVGDPDNTLPSARQEALEVADSLKPFFGSDVLIGPYATKDRFIELAPNAQVLHIASHAEFEPEAPDFARIMLAGEWRDREKDLEVADIMNLGLPAAFVVLSGCNTGLATTDASNEMIGLVRSFLIAGASGIVATRWPIYDASTADFMRLFYRRLIEDNEHPAEALRNARAQHSSDDGYTHPGHWAAFTFFGVPPGWNGSGNKLFVERKSS